MSRNDGLGATVGGTTPERWGLEATGPSLPWEGCSYRFLDQKALSSGQRKEYFMKNYRK